jgi:hypothetical protein
LAHHSHASFDVKKEIKIDGTVTQVIWTNPHTLLFMEAKTADDAAVKKWAVEAPSPIGLSRTGWTKESIKVGDKITATGSPSRSGQPMILVKEVVTSEGKHFVARPD